MYVMLNNITYNDLMSFQSTTDCMYDDRSIDYKTAEKFLPPNNIMANVLTLCYSATYYSCDCGDACVNKLIVLPEYKNTAHSIIYST